MRKRKEEIQTMLEAETGGARVMTLAEFARFIGKDRRLASTYVADVPRQKIGRTICFYTSDLAGALADREQPGEGKPPSGCGLQ